MKSKVAVLGAVGLFACSSAKNDGPPDASSAAIEARASARAVATFAALARFPSLQGHLGRGGSLLRADEGFRVKSLAKATTIAGGASLAITLPLRADGAVHVARADLHAAEPRLRKRRHVSQTVPRIGVEPGGELLDPLRIAGEQFGESAPLAPPDALPGAFDRVAHVQNPFPSRRAPD